MNATTLIVSRQGDAAELEEALIERFRAAGACVLVVPHLYHIPDKSPLWQELAQRTPGDVIVFSWLYPRPAEWVLRRHGVSGLISAFHLGELPDADAGFAAAAKAMNLEVGDLASLPPGEVVRLEEATGQRWYPVVDGLRCINCHHCLQFCLFGVYSLDQGQLVASEPDRCKPGCPACSRICPQGAIMFPLYQKDAAIAGAPGLLMSPDLAARRMFYMRTKRPCPACGRTQHGQNPPNVEPESLCPECGGVRAQPVPATAPKPAFDDLDALVDELDAVMRRKA